LRVSALASVIMASCGRRIRLFSTSTAEPQPDIAILRPRADFYRLSQPMIGQPAVYPADGLRAL
jgi:hypothetical protein